MDISKTSKRGSRRFFLLFFLIFLCFESSSFAINCVHAKNIIENAICSNPQLAVADKNLNASYEKLQSQMPSAEKSALRQAQISWIDERDQKCNSTQSLKPLAECLKFETLARALFLRGEPEEGPGGNSLITPAFSYSAGKKPYPKLLIEVLKFHAPQKPVEKMFNSEISELSSQALSDAKAPIELEGDFFVALHARLIYRSENFVSAQVNYESNLGQAHPFRFQSSVNVDFRKGRLLNFSDLVDETAAQKIFERCSASITQSKNRNETEINKGSGKFSIDPSEVARNTSDLRNWSFRGKEASITYPEDAFGGYGEGAYQCIVPYSILRPLANSTFPLPE